MEEQTRFEPINPQVSQADYIPVEISRDVQADFISKVYGWMSFALLITAFTAVFTATTPAIIDFIFGTRFMFMGLLIGEILMVGYLVTAVQRMAYTSVIFTFIVYSILNGLTLSVVFLAYTSASIASTFFVTAGTFAVMSAYGYFTKKDLTSLGNLFFMALIGFVIASVVNYFLRNEMLYWVITYVGIFLFIGLIAYDTNKLKYMIAADGEQNRKISIIGALTLYLDFINLFLLLLRVLGRRR